MKSKSIYTQLTLLLVGLAVCFMGMRPDEALATGLAVSHLTPGFMESGGIGELAALGIPAVGMIINQTTIAAIFQGFKTIFNQAFSGVMPAWDKVAMRVPSSAKTELYAWLGAFPKMREWLGDRVIANIKTHDYTLVNKKYEVTIEVERDDIEDDQIGVYNPIVAELGRQAATHVDELVFGLLATAHAVICYDGQFFFDTDHPVGDGVVSNDLAGAATPWFLLDTTRAVKPFIFQDRRPAVLTQKTNANDSDHVFNTDKYLYGVDARRNVGVGLWQLAIRSEAVLDTTNYAAARTAMMSFKDDEGTPLGIMATLLVVPPSLEKAAREVLRADRQANGASNVYKDSADLLVSPWLA